MADLKTYASEVGGKYASLELNARPGKAAMLTLNIIDDEGHSVTIFESLERASMKRMMRELLEELSSLETRLDLAEIHNEYKAVPERLMDTPAPMFDQGVTELLNQVCNAVAADASAPDYPL